MRHTEKRDLRNSTELPAPRYKLLIVDERKLALKKSLHNARQTMRR